MPTDVAKGERRKTAIQRIHAAAQSLTGSSIPLELPTRSQYGSDMLLIVQLETLAEYLENQQPVQVKLAQPRRVVGKKPALTTKKKKEVNNAS
jgi:2-keto-4-pentenoate hydratase